MTQLGNAGTARTAAVHTVVPTGSADWKRITSVATASERDADRRVAIVTGGGRGIGRCIASVLAEAGCHERYAPEVTAP